MTDRELEKQAERDLSLNDTLIEAYIKGAGVMRDDCPRCDTEIVCIIQEPQSLAALTQICACPEGWAFVV